MLSTSNRMNPENKKKHKIVFHYEKKSIGYNLHTIQLASPTFLSATTLDISLFYIHSIYTVFAGVRLCMRGYVLVCVCAPPVCYEWYCIYANAHSCPIIIFIHDYHWGYSYLHILFTLSFSLSGFLSLSVSQMGGLWEGGFSWTSVPARGGRISRLASVGGLQLWTALCPGYPNCERQFCNTHTHTVSHTLTHTQCYSVNLMILYTEIYK